MRVCLQVFERWTATPYADRPNIPDRERGRAENEILTILGEVFGLRVCGDRCILYLQVKPDTDGRLLDLAAEGGKLQFLLAVRFEILLRRQGR